MKFLTALFFILFFISCSEEKIESQVADKPQTKKKGVRLATLDWQPYVGQDLEGKGYVYELIIEAFREEGIEVSIEFLPFARILNLARDGQIDGYFPEYMSEENRESYYYSDPYPGGDVGFLKLKKSNIHIRTERGMKRFQSLKDLRIGIVRGYTNTKEFDSASYLKKEEANSDLSNLKKLFFNRIDLIFIDPNVANYLISTQLGGYTGSKDAYQFIDPGLEYKELYTCFSKKATHGQKYLRSFNKGLKKLKSKGRLDEILKKHKFSNGRYQFSN